MKRSVVGPAWAFVLLPLVAGLAGLGVAAAPPASPQPPVAAGAAQSGVAALAASGGALVARASTKKRAPVSFANDLVPVFTKIGCNNGSCHGQQNGQGGFKMSLHGWDPAGDYEQIVKADNGRRVYAKVPARSLLIAKPRCFCPTAAARPSEETHPNTTSFCVGCAKA